MELPKGFYNMLRLNKTLAWVNFILGLLLIVMGLYLQAILNLVIAVYLMLNTEGK